MKMASVISPQNACGQILFSLQMSNLNYVIKETPYSAYITIRKKFARSIETVHEPNRVDTKTSDAEKEILGLKERNKDVECRLALARVDFEEKELKYEALEKEKIKVEDELEKMYRDNSDLKGKLEESVMLISELKRKNVELSGRKEGILKEFENYKRVEKKRFIDKSDDVSILEHTLENKNVELDRIRDSLEKAHRELEAKEKDIKDMLNHTCKTCDCIFMDGTELKNHILNVHTYTCNTCDCVCKDETELKNHILNVHQFKCEECGLVVKSKEKLSSHICKLYLKNPSFKNVYLKNWIVNKGCNTVYCNNRRMEIAILHSDECYLLNPRTSKCGHLPGEYFVGTPTLQDVDDVYHLQLSTFIQKGEVNWPLLRKEMKLK